MARISFEFEGSKTKHLSLDTQEFVGLSMHKATEIIQTMLMEADDAVYWSTDDIVIAAETLTSGRDGEES